MSTTEKDQLRSLVSQLQIDLQNEQDRRRDLEEERNKFKVGYESHAFLLVWDACVI